MNLTSGVDGRGGAVGGRPRNERAWIVASKRQVAGPGRSTEFVGPTELKLAHRGREECKGSASTSRGLAIQSRDIARQSADRVPSCVISEWDCSERFACGVNSWLATSANCA